MSELDSDICKGAERAVGMATNRGGTALDFSEASIATVEEILAEVAQYASQMSGGELQTISEDFGCYVLEVARRTYGGRYFWYQGREPILVVGDDESHVAIATWGKVRGRLSGDEADNIPFFVAFLAAQAGFVAGAILSGLAGRVVLERVGGTLEIDASIHLVTLVVPFVAGGAASAWAYRRWRNEVMVNS